MRKVLLFSGLMISFGLVAVAQQDQAFSRLAEGPAGVLLTAEERIHLNGLSGDDETKSFTELFWIRRDPDLGTRANEFRIDFEARVVAADEQFPEENLRGALTDRGKVLLLLGVPSQRETGSIDAYLGYLYRDRRSGGTHGSLRTGTEDMGRLDHTHIHGLVPRGWVVDTTVPEEFRETSGLDMQTKKHGVLFNLARGVATIWTFSRDQIPESVPLPEDADSVTFAFFDSNGDGHFRLQTGIRRAKSGLEVLAAMPAAKVANPTLMEVPHFPLIPGAQPASETELGWLNLDPARWPDGAQVQLVRGIQNEAEFPAWLFLRLPESMPKGDLLVGRLIREDGTVEGSFRVATSGLKTALGRTYELAFPAPQTFCTVEFALVAAGQPLATGKLVVNPVKRDPDSPFITAMIAGGEFFEVDTYQPGSPFVFGGYHLIPRPDGHYGLSENLNYFCLLTGLSEAKAGNPKALVKLDLFRHGQAKAVYSPPQRTVELSPVAPKVFMFGSQLPLSILPGGGEYRLELVLTEPQSGSFRRSQIQLVLAEE
jgi:GWxTD domain-containing protein